MYDKTGYTKIPAGARPPEDRPVGKKPVRAGRRFPGEPARRHSARRVLDQLLRFRRHEALVRLFAGGAAVVCAEDVAQADPRLGLTLAARLLESLRQAGLACIRKPETPAAGEESSGRRSAGRIAYGLTERGESVMRLLRDLAEIDAAAARGTVRPERRGRTASAAACLRYLLRQHGALRLAASLENAEEAAHRDGRAGGGVPVGEGDLPQAVVRLGTGLFIRCGMMTRSRGATLRGVGYRVEPFGRAMAGIARAVLALE
ncbi:hypothetical protein OpiT1DRAFT_01338 [Opitutaceae bacterium TAV1]|nr:hypothetical protein OpiT1DRAFT_01338 [Opitutaceae bacterium TAV1]